MATLILDADRPEDETLVTFTRRPGMGAHVPGHPASFESQRHWMITSLEVVRAAEREYAMISVVRGCYYAVRVSVTELRSEWPTRILCPPRQSMSLSAEHPEGEIVLRVRWKHLEELSA